MKKTDCYQLGYVAKTHGLHGEIGVVLDVDDASLYEDLDSVLIEIKNQLVPHFVESITANNDKFIVALEGVDSLDKAKNLVGTTLYLPLSRLPKLKKGQFYFHEIIGYTVEDSQEGRLGIVRDVFSETSQPIIAMDYQGVEVLIPLSDEIVHEPNHETKTLPVSLPEGLLAVYMQTEDDEERDEDTAEEETI